MRPLFLLLLLAAVAVTTTSGEPRGRKSRNRNVFRKKEEVEDEKVEEDLQGEEEQPRRHRKGKCEEDGRREQNDLFSPSPHAKKLSHCCRLKVYRKNAFCFQCSRCSTSSSLRTIPVAAPQP